jgi:hypothetical protein
MKPFAARGFASQLVISTLVMFGASASVGVGAVWMRHQISVTANETKALDARATEVERRIAETTAAIEAEQDADVLLRRNAEWHLGLVPPTDAQIVRVAADPVQHLAAKRNRALLGEGGMRVSFPVALQR